MHKCVKSVHKSVENQGNSVHFPYISVNNSVDKWGKLTFNYCIYKEERLCLTEQSLSKEEFIEAK